MTARVAEVRSRAALAFANKPKPSSQLLPAFHQSKMSLDGSLDYATVQPGQYEAHRAGKIAERTAFMKALGFQDVVPPPPTTTKRAPRAPTPPAKTKETPHRACAPKLGDFEKKKEEEEEEEEEEERRASKQGGGRWANGVRKFRARIRIDSKQHHLGWFDTREEMQAAFAKARKKHPSKRGQGGGQPAHRRNRKA